MNIDYSKMLAEVNVEITKFLIDSQAQNDKFALAMQSAAEVAVLKHELYKYRYDYVVKRFKQQDRVAEIQEFRKKATRDVLISQKTKQALDPDFVDFKFEPRNNDEKKILDEHYLAALDRVVQVLNNYISTINDAIMTIDKMTFGIPYVIELEKYKNHFAS